MWCFSILAAYGAVLKLLRLGSHSPRDPDSVGLGCGSVIKSLKIFPRDSNMQAMLRTVVISEYQDFENQTVKVQLLASF